MGLFSRAKEKASAAAGTASRSASQAAGAVAATAEAGASSSVAAAAAAAGAATGAAGAVTGAAARTAGQVEATARSTAARAATEVEETVRSAGVAMAAAGVDVACGKIAAMAKTAVVDPDMPKPMQRTAEAVIDGVMPEVRDFLLDSATAGLRKKIDDSAKMTASKPNFPAAIRAHVLYTMFPHDRTIWACLKDPWWWVYTQGLGAFPLWGVTTAWWFVVLSFKDRTDEFQLVDFVVAFTASQFTTACVQAMVVGATLYASCIPDCAARRGTRFARPRRGIPPPSSGPS